MVLQMQHLVGRYAGQDALEAGMVGAVQEELLPEALGQVRLVVFVLW